MIQFFSGLSSLFVVAIILLLLFAGLHYRSFRMGRTDRRSFPVFFLATGFVCVSFLLLHFNPGRWLDTFTNADHHFIRHDGFLLQKTIRLGAADTASNNDLPYNDFAMTPSADGVQISSSYSEEPLFVSGKDGSVLASTSFPVESGAISFDVNRTPLRFSVKENKLTFNAGPVSVSRELSLRKGATLWSLLQSDSAVINLPVFRDPSFPEALRQLFIIQYSDDEARFFVSGKLFAFATSIVHGETRLTPSSLRFNVNIPDGQSFTWGLGVAASQRNLMTVVKENRGTVLRVRYPSSYPLTPERRESREAMIAKFIVADQGQMTRVPSIFREGFMFGGYSALRENSFPAVLMTYEPSTGNSSLQPRLQRLADMSPVPVTDQQFTLPMHSGNAAWLFSIADTTDWQFAGFSIPSSIWKWLIVGSLLFFIAAVLAGFYWSRNDGSFIAQVLAIVSVVFLTTRFFLYWRYKTFPPYDGIDLPSRQQLESAGNFLIIPAAALLLGMFFGAAGFFRKAKVKFRFSSLSVLTRRIPALLRKNPLVSFITCWLIILIGSIGFAWANGFDPGISRHLAILLLLLYFLFLFISYRFSPLTASQGEEWWQISSNRTLEMLVSNPLKILLSFSLLGSFLLIDIGFAIVFLNFILFHEAFVCINYGIGGLSSGSNRNARLFITTGIIWLAAFVLNLLYAPHIFNFILDLPQAGYYVIYFIASFIPAYVFYRLAFRTPQRKSRRVAVTLGVAVFLITSLFFRKEFVLDKAAMTRYRIDVLIHPASEAVANAYRDGKTYEPVIRAAQNQWFINTFIDPDNNPGMAQKGFQMLQHAPQNKGAKYNAQATDLVTSRFLVAEHGKSSALLYVFLLLIPGILVSSFYKLYPDFTNRTNAGYPAVNAGFAILNYLIIASLLVTLAATGRYIFFGQDLPFASILSKQSIIFPSMLVITILLVFARIPAEHYRHRLKFLPGLAVFSLLAVMLLFVRPGFNREKQFNLATLSDEVSTYTEAVLQPLFTSIDTASFTRSLDLASRDAVFTDTLRQLLQRDAISFPSPFIRSQVGQYARGSFAAHTDRRRLLSLDISTGAPQMAVNENYFRVEAPPHLQQLWTGNVFSDTSFYNVSAWDAGNGQFIQLSPHDDAEQSLAGWSVSIRRAGLNHDPGLYLVNHGGPLQINSVSGEVILGKADSLRLRNPSNLTISDSLSKRSLKLSVEPDAFMRNYYVNGSRYYVYPLAYRFNWARNFAEAVSPALTEKSSVHKDVFVSLDYRLTDSLLAGIQELMRDTAFRDGAEYGITIADGMGRMLALADHIKGFQRPDPNEKLAFAAAIEGENGIVMQSTLRKQVGNINLLRLNPGPGSTLKPIVFTAIASQLNLDWSLFASDGFTEKQERFGGEKVAPYDFEKNNGRISNVSDYLRYSDNYYHSNVLLLGSYRKQDPQQLLKSQFSLRGTQGFSWPYFSYSGKTYWLNDFSHWPGYSAGKADFGSDSSYTSIGLHDNFQVASRSGQSIAREKIHPFITGNASFISPEAPVFDQTASGMDHRIPYDVFLTGFRGHVKGSSQVMMSPASMVEGYGKLVTLNRNYHLTFDAYPPASRHSAFQVDPSIGYNQFMDIVSNGVFKGMKDALFAGTAGALGARLKDGNRFFYYAKTGTTGDDEKKTKSKLLAVVISKSDITDPGYVFRDNLFYTIYFTSQNGPAKQNEEFQAKVIKMIERTAAFRRYMGE